MFLPVQIIKLIDHNSLFLLTQNDIDEITIKMYLLIVILNQNYFYNVV